MRKRAPSIVFGCNDRSPGRIWRFFIIYHSFTRTRGGFIVHRLLFPRFRYFRRHGGKTRRRRVQIAFYQTQYY